MWVYCTFFSSGFLRGLLPCVRSPRTNDLAYVRHTSDGAQAVRDLGPIYSDWWDPFAQWNCVFSPLDVAVFLFPVRCGRLLISRLVSNVEHYILRERIFLFQAQKFWSFVGSRTRVLSFRSAMFFHCTSRPGLLYLFLKLFSNSERQWFIISSVDINCLLPTYGNAYHRPKPN